jgi:single-strand DNA-binding protein
VAIEGEIRSHECQREVAVGNQKTSIPQRVWEIRVDCVLKLDRAAKRESNEDSNEEVPR